MMRPATRPPAGLWRGWGRRLTTPRTTIQRMVIPSNSGDLVLDARVLRPSFIPLLGPMHLVRRGLEPLFHGCVGIRHAHHHLVLFSLPAAAHAPRRARIWRAWWRAWTT